MMPLDQYLIRWSQLHQGIDPTKNRWVHGYLRVMYQVMYALRRLKLTPNRVTAFSGFFSIVIVASATTHYLWLCALLLLKGLLLDGLDGAVAIAHNKASTFGGVFDSVMDRFNEAAALLTLLILADFKPIALSLIALMFVMVQEYARPRARAAQPALIERVTLWERPTRIIVAIAGLVVAQAAAAFTNIHVQDVISATLVLWIAFGVVGLWQLISDIRKQLH